MSIPPKKYPESFNEAVFADFVKGPLNEEDYHYHKKHMEICLITSGRFVYVFNGRRYELSPYDMIFIPDNTSHKLVSLNSSNPKCIILNFKKELFKEQSSNNTLLLKIFSEPKFSIPSDNIVSIDNIFTKLVYESDYPSLFSAELLKQYVYELLVSLYRLTHNLNLPKRLPTKKVVEAALKFIAESYQDDITLNDVASFCHVDRHYLSRTFKETMGIGLISYLNTIRIHEASTMLLETNKSILEISENCGFNTVKHFCDVFKKLKGMSATEFRKSTKNKI